MLLQNNSNVSIIIQNTIFNDLINVAALYYHGETYGISVNNKLTIRNSIISNNTGDSYLKMFLFVLYSMQRIALTQLYYLQQYNHISFTNCSFVNNSKMRSVIYVQPANSRATTGYFNLKSVMFCKNINTHFFIMNTTVESIWQWSNHIEIGNTMVTSNIHDEGQDLTFFVNSWVKTSGPLIIADNCYFTTIARFHLSSLTFQYDINIFNNTVRQIFICSFVFLRENTTINVSRNTVYMLEDHFITYDKNSEPICALQFYSENDNFFPSLRILSFHFVISNNVHMISSKHFLNYDYNCNWFAGSTFQKAGLQAVMMAKLLNILQTDNNTEVSNEVYKRPIPLSICTCKYLNSSPDIGDTSIDCYSPHLGRIFPGQTLKVELQIQKQWLYYIFPTPIVAENTLNDDCSIVDISQLSQAHLNHSCTSYSYTLWPKNETVKVCKLFIGLPNMPETFYVEFKHCPLGFTLQGSRKSCYCDPVLTNNDVVHIESCNLSYGTILRPPHSWIFAKKDYIYNTTYAVSSYCPFDHCFPHQSNLNLSNPDLQCQFKRTGLLCGKCQRGLSSVFGLHKCKECSSIFLLLIIPIAIAGIALVILLYIFNLTVRNGTVNTCLFYFNVININVLTLFPNCQSFTCVILSLMNFDFKVETCFYNGMDDYAKEWIQLMLSFYLIIIATIFIILSRYSNVVQRMTAKRALPVLATLFLLSYTKVLIIVCNVLFRYSSITHLPSNKTELVWSISTTTPLFGLKFLALFIVCLILFLILLLFNLILMFTRPLSCLKLVTTLKPLLDTYFGSYKDRAYYWTGLLLLVRVIVYVLSALDEDMSLVVITVLFGGLLCLHAAVQPFKSNFHNIQECIIILNLLAVHTVLLYTKNTVGLTIVMILIRIGVTYFTIAILLHCCMYRWSSSIHKSIKQFLCKVKSICFKFWRVEIPQGNQNIQMQDSADQVPCNYGEFQEPLLAIEPDK